MPAVETDDLWLRWLLGPEAMPTDPAERRRARLSVGFSGVGIVTAVALCTVQVLGGTAVLAVGAGVSVVLGALTPLLMRWTRRPAVGANWLVGLWAVGITFVVSLRGIDRPVAMAYAVVPMLAIVLAGRRSGYFWLALTALLVPYLTIRQMTGEFEAIALASPLPVTGFGHLVFTVGLFLLGLAHERMQRVALEEAAARERAVGEAERQRLVNETEAQLLRQSRMAQLGTLAAGVAHEINNPLNYIYANVTHLQDEDPQSPEELQRALAQMSRGAEQIRKIVADIRMFSRPLDEEQSGPVDLRQVLQSSIDLLAHEIRNGSEAIVEIEPAQFFGLGNASRLGQVFVNVLMNAVHANREAGGESRRLAVRGRCESDRAVIEISDEGPGVDAETRQRAFEPFFTTRVVGKGTGLGLSICIGILDAIGGSIEFVEGGGPGATVRITLQQAAPPRSDSAR